MLGQHLGLLGTSSWAWARGGGLGPRAWAQLDQGPELALGPDLGPGLKSDPGQNLNLDFVPDCGSNF